MHVWCTEERHLYLRAVPEFLSQLPATLGSHGPLHALQEGDGLGDVAADVLLGGREAGDESADPTLEAERGGGGRSVRSGQLNCCYDLEHDEPHSPALRWEGGGEGGTGREGGREGRGKGREGKGREGKGREGKGGKGREGEKGRSGQWRREM